MDNIKPWQVVLMVIAVGVLGFTVWRSMVGGSVPKTSGYTTVDIMTGQLYDIQKGKAKGVPLPAKHPDTGERTLYPVNQVDDLIWEVPDGYSGFLTDKVREGSKLTKGKLEIEVLANQPISFNLK